MIGNHELGETIGKLTYAGIDVVSFLSGADKMLKSFGMVNTEVTGTTGPSAIWGETHFDDVIEHEFNKLSIDDFIRSHFMSANSLGNLVIEAGKNVKSVYSGAEKVVEELVEIATGK